ncbi:neuropeptide Y receptor type 6-like [Mercenaria mercenaria]|uniref:neuropeptide Y receptor type 6-like n=1 Tax=Mercenaria mercenaria TaxID=6596 RepID=UPI00234EF384|nr:neuropeptide Y receptor type 6-like [Mercenaria mercenaria]
MPGNDSYIEQDVFKQSLPLTTIFIILYTIVFFTGIGGNSLVIYVVLRNKAMQSTMNIFITNLAVSDILICLLPVPFTPLSYFMHSWIFGEFFCHVVPMTLCVLVYVSILTCTSLAVVRYYAIVYPLKPSMKPGVCLMYIVSVWMISVALSLPLGIFHQIEETDSTTSCVEKWPNDVTPQFFVLTSLVLQYIVPCSIITYCYFNISLELQRRSKSRIVNESLISERIKREIGRNRRINKLMIAVVAIFVLCWLPLNLVLLAGEYHPKFSNHPYYPVIFFTAHVIAMSSAIYNPFLYAWKCENFKKEFKHVLHCLCR